MSRYAAITFGLAFGFGYFFTHDGFSFVAAIAALVWGFSLLLNK